MVIPTCPNWSPDLPRIAPQGERIARPVPLRLSLQSWALAPRRRRLAGRWESTQWLPGEAWRSGHDLGKVICGDNLNQLGYDPYLMMVESFKHHIPFKSISINWLNDVWIWMDNPRTCLIIYIYMTYVGLMDFCWWNSAWCEWLITNFSYLSFAF